MKKLLAILLALCAILSLAACGGNTASGGSAPAGSAQTAACDSITLKSAATKRDVQTATPAAPKPRLANFQRSARTANQPNIQNHRPIQP